LVAGLADIADIDQPLLLGRPKLPPVKKALVFDGGFFDAFPSPLKERKKWPVVIGAVVIGPVVIGAITPTIMTIIAVTMIIAAIVSCPERRYIAG
jgi:uncharacterized membrane protein